jgi:tRNA nucleotidyltransferase/poly(A) polymerase
VTVTLYEVGGCVRDELLGVKSKDIDYTAVVTGDVEHPYAHLRRYLVDQGFTIFVETPQYLTIRAQFPKLNGQKRAVTADFVLARKDGEYTDGRRPDTVEAGTLFDDLKRRDFTVNAIAKDHELGLYIDPFGGQEDLKAGVLRCVGSAEDRLREDALRALRALRFAVTKGFVLDPELWIAMRSEWLPLLVAKVSAERRREELSKAFRHDTLETLFCLGQLPSDLKEAIFAGGLRLDATLKD